MESTRTLGASAHQTQAVGHSRSTRRVTRTRRAAPCQWQPRPVHISFKFKLRSKVDYPQVVAVARGFPGPSGTSKSPIPGPSRPDSAGKIAGTRIFPIPIRQGSGKFPGFRPRFPMWPGIGKSSVLGVVHSHGDRIQVLASDLRRIA
jgi:hypothetical protein